jgi:putative ABC transport system permease protein
VVRTNGAPLQYGPAIRQAVLQVDPEQAVANLRPLTEVLHNSTSQQRFNAVLLTLFASLALLLAAIGVYGVLSYAISQRTNEIGLRVALGATRADVLRLVLGQGLTPAFVGLALGLAAAVGLSRFLDSLLFGLSARDPLTFAAVGFILLAVCVFAALVPALRALKVDPIVALRYE